jgi:Uma2 family endonuclease
MAAFYLEIDPDTLVAPDVAFVRGDCLEGNYPHRGFAQLTPDFAIEVRSPNDEPRHIRAKQALYDRTGIPLVWWVDPKALTVSVCQPGTEPAVIDRTGVLDGGDVLPGFELPVSRIFRT